MALIANYISQLFPAMEQNTPSNRGAFYVFRNPCYFSQPHAVAFIQLDYVAAGAFSLFVENLDRERYREEDFSSLLFHHCDSDSHLLRNSSLQRVNVTRDQVVPPAL